MARRLTMPAAVLTALLSWQALPFWLMTVVCNMTAGCSVSDARGIELARVVPGLAVQLLAVRNSCAAMVQDLTACQFSQDCKAAQHSEHLRVDAALEGESHRSSS